VFCGEEISQPDAGVVGLKMIAQGLQMATWL